MKADANDCPPVLDPSKVGSYPALTKSGGGFVWDEVLEYRVWCHPEGGAPDECDGEDYYYAFDTYRDALAFSESREGAENPLALVLQREHINEPEPGVFEHVTDERITEWRVEWLARSRRTERTIPDFFSADAPANRLEILRGERGSQEASSFGRLRETLGRWVRRAAGQ